MNRPGKSCILCRGNECHARTTPLAPIMLTLDPYVVDVLLPDLVGHDRRPSAYLVYLALWRKAHDAGGEIDVTLRSLTEATGLSKRAVQDALAHLAKRRLISAHRATTSSVARFRVHEPWIERRRAKSAGKGASA